ncbi:DUF397 domain-containing protein [Solihabitans fulvus]|uniref:DUF397 domain-containing protein n=1 Tax=Solihabitans fulvus TaxID=1892852 RepID=A0A5B2WX64_9PSEU|nr:DUF397 domain-containing protein [Solihabitans fulvus]KAA2255470.1 DUF397 domain-containing protein [Solihabitans fulvus]
MSERRSRWRKSSRSGGTNGNCVEMTFHQWRKSSRSNSQSACVEVAHVPTTAAIRDSKNPDGPILAMSHTELTGFVAAIKAGRFNN